MTITGENITLTKKELSGIIEEAVINAIKKMQNTEEVISATKNNSEKKAAEMTEFSSEQYAEAMQTMAVNHGNGDEPKVGIFWYNVGRNELFGVVSHKTSDYKKPNAGGGLITCSEMHEDVWKKSFNKQKYHGGNGPFVGAYQDKPRGRVFYSPQEDKYIIAIGKWYYQHEEVYDLLMEEFDLPEEKTIVKYGEHWDIGQTWM